MFSKRTRLNTNFNLINFFQVIKSLFVKNKSFEKKIKLYLNTENVSLTSQGRTALYEIVKIIIENTNKKTFFVAPYTIPAVIHAITYAGAEVVFVDIDKNTGLINENKLEEKIDNNSAAVVITHLYSNEDNIKKFIKKFEKKIKIIEDAAINFGAKVDGKYLGTLCDYGFFSFNLVKNLNTLNGGAIFIKDKSEYEKFKTSYKKDNFPIIITLNLLLTAIIIKFVFNNLSYQFFHYILKFIYKKKINFILKRIYPVLFHKFEEKLPKIYTYDFNWSMNDVGNYNLDQVNQGIEERIKKAQIYKLHIKDSVAIKTECIKNENALLEYPIILKNIDNKEAHNILMREGYDIRHTWYINNVRDIKNLNKNDFADTFFLEKHILCLPLHKNISQSDIIELSNLINKYF